MYLPSVQTGSHLGGGRLGGFRCVERQSVIPTTPDPRTLLMTDARAFRGFRFPAEIILWAVRWYLQFPISYRDLEGMLAAHGVAVDHTTMYRWVRRFGCAGISHLSASARISARRDPACPRVWRHPAAYGPCPSSWTQWPSHPWSSLAASPSGCAPQILICDGEKITGGAVFGRPAPEIAPPSPRPRDHGRRPGDFLQQPHARPSPS